MALAMPQRVSRRLPPLLSPATPFIYCCTANKACFPFFPDRPCRGFQEVLSRYNEITPGIAMAGPTNFAPGRVLHTGGTGLSSPPPHSAVIRETINIVRATRGYHILVLIADGQVTDVDDTTRAIVEASNFPISVRPSDAVRFV